MEAQSLSSHQHSWWFSCFSLREKLARSHNSKNQPGLVFLLPLFFPWEGDGHTGVLANLAVHLDSGSVALEGMFDNGET